MEQINYLKLIILCLMFYLSSEYEDTEEKEERIIGGQYTSNERYPFHAVIQYVSGSFWFIDFWETICGGAIIHYNFVVTAGRCARNKRVRLLMGTGEINRVTQNSDYIWSVRDVYCHGESEIKGSHKGDICLIQTNSFVDEFGLTWIDILKEESLGKNDTLYPGETIGHGWVFYHKYGKLSLSIKRADIIINNFYREKGKPTRYDPDVFSIEEYSTSETPTTGRACHGDLGAPIMVQFRGKLHLVGIIVEIPDDCSDFSVGLRIETYLPFIDLTIEENATPRS